MKRTKKKENKSMEDFKIGDEIKIVLKVEEDNGGCDNCFFVEDGLCRKPINRFVGEFGCLKEERSDHKDVRFELVSCNTDDTKTNLWHDASEKPVMSEHGMIIVELNDITACKYSLWRSITTYECLCNNKGYIRRWLYLDEITKTD